jgi:hypothetical protein
MVKKWPAQENNIFFPLCANKTSVILLPVEFSQRSAFLHAEELSWSTHKMERTCYVSSTTRMKNPSPSAAKDAVKPPQRPI